MPGSDSRVAASAVFGSMASPKSRRTGPRNGASPGDPPQAVYSSGGTVSSTMTVLGAPDTATEWVAWITHDDVEDPALQRQYVWVIQNEISVPEYIPGESAIRSATGPFRAVVLIVMIPWPPRFCTR